MAVYGCYANSSQIILNILIFVQFMWSFYHFIPSKVAVTKSLQPYDSLIQEVKATVLTGMTNYLGTDKNYNYTIGQDLTENETVFPFLKLLLISY